MSMYGTRCEIFEKVLASLIDDAAGLDGLDLADILQRAATKVVKESLSGFDARDAALVGLIDTARQELAAARNHMANPTGIGGVRFQPGVSGNPSGRSRAQQMGMSGVQLHALKFCIEAVELIAGIMRSSTGDKADSVRLTAAKEILDRGIGRPQQGLDVSMTLTKRLDEMSVEELLAFKERYIAMTTAAPALIEQVLADDEQPATDLVEGDAANEADGALLAEEPAPSPRRRGRPQRQQTEEI